MDALYFNDSFYESATYAWVGACDAKKLFLYGVSKEVMKTAIAMLEDKDHLEGADANDRMGKLVLGSIMDTQTYRIRKMVELLSILILFDRGSAKDEEYRIFLNAESLDLDLARLKDFSILHDKRVIENTQHSVSGFAERIHQDLKTLDKTTLWFLNVANLKKLRPSVFASRKSMFLGALLVALPDERLALGISYGRGYSQASQAVHPLIGSHDYGRDSNTHQLRTNFTYLGIIALHILRLAHRLAGIEDPEGMAQALGPNLEKSEAPQTLRSLQKQFEVGDIVLTAWNDIAEVLDAHVSEYGYTAYRVRYLSRAPIPEIPEDWLESQSLLRLLPKSAIREMLRKASESDAYPKDTREFIPEMLKLPDETLIKFAGETFVELHKAGVLVPMLSQQGYLKRRDVS